MNDMGMMIQAMSWKSAEESFEHIVISPSSLAYVINNGSLSVSIVRDNINDQSIEKDSVFLLVDFSVSLHD